MSSFLSLLVLTTLVRSASNAIAGGLSYLEVAGSTFLRVAQSIGQALKRYVLKPFGREFDRVFAPIDRLLEPLADRWNERMGPYFGEMTGLQFGFLFGSVLALLTAGWWGQYAFNGMLSTLALACIWAIFAMGWDIQSGYTGYISFGHSVLSGAAGYTTALLLANVSPELSFWITAPLSVLAAVVIGLLIALPTLRLEGPYFSLITFVAVLLFYRLVTAIDQLGGETGFQGPSAFTWDPVMRYYYMLIPMLLIALALTYLSRSNLGMILVAIRENEEAVSAAGLNPTKFKIWSFVLSSIVMGIGGVLLVGYRGNVDPTTFIVVDRSIEMIAMAVVGGMSSILGPIGGAFLIEILDRELLTLFGFSSSMRYMLLFLLVILVLVFARRGLFRKLWHRLADVRGETQ